MTIRQAHGKQNLKKRLLAVIRRLLGLRAVAWAVVVALILLIPVFGNIYVDGWNWDGFDFVFAGVLLYGCALVYELISRKSPNREYRFAVGLAVVNALLLVWINAAVGLIGDGDFPNLMYFGVLAIGFIGALIARFKPQGMTKALLVTAFAQFLVPVIALFIWPPVTNSWDPGVLKVFCLNSVFALLFVGSALLFRHATTERE